MAVPVHMPSLRPQLCHPFLLGVIQKFFLKAAASCSKVMAQKRKGDFPLPTLDI